MAIRKQIILEDPWAEEEVRLSIAQEEHEGEKVITMITAREDQVDLRVQDLIDALYDLVPEKFNVSPWPPGAKGLVQDNNLRHPNGPETVMRDGKVEFLVRDELPNSHGADGADRSNKPTVRMPIGGAVLRPAELPDMCKWTRFDPNEVIGPGVAPENQLSTKLPEDLQ